MSADGGDVDQACWKRFDEARQVMMRRFADALHHAPAERGDVKDEIAATQRAMQSLVGLGAGDA